MAPFTIVSYIPDLTMSHMDENENNDVLWIPTIRDNGPRIVGIMDNF